MLNIIYDVKLTDFYECVLPVSEPYCLIIQKNVSVRLGSRHVMEWYSVVIQPIYNRLSATFSRCHDRVNDDRMS